MRKLTIYLHIPKERWLTSATIRSLQPNIILMQSCPIMARRGGGSVFS